MPERKPERSESGAAAPFLWIETGQATRQTHAFVPRPCRRPDRYGRAAEAQLAHASVR
jgi:hypothetical protein